MNKRFVASELTAIARSLVAVRGKDVFGELGYALAVLNRQIPTYNNWGGALFWLERARSHLKSKKRYILSKIDASTYKAVLDILDKYEAAWDAKSDAQTAIEKADEAIDRLKSQSSTLQNLLYEFSE